MTEVQERTDFDVRAFARNAQGPFRDELDLAPFAAEPLDPADRDLVRFIGRVESATMEHFRDVLMTATHKDARVTAFLVTWAYERSWIADALDAVLEAHGDPRARAVAEERARRRWGERRAWRGPLWRTVIAVGQRDAVVGAHMAAGLIDEWVLGAAYQVLAERAGNGALRKVIDRIAAIKRRHEEFFAAETHRRLTASVRAVRVARGELKHAVWPIGSLRRAPGDRRRFHEAVFGATDGWARAEAIGKKVAAIPGLTRRIGARIAARLRKR
ncbi:hypothetical protein [Actinoplanes sp. NBRC 103695]|uniref:hypothetical protein n=1 Tax=Actinoplanes sp. NBRC 103695 TaxID=3032202 RepID=UPI0024A1AE8D|nr:hypothetical protein [Actinoplanes sp. NBRC 103695]GLY97544.1 hypothetical protein Acsp02_47980 [Actinoplanes sp. NBRC 103695]